MGGREIGWRTAALSRRPRSLLSRSRLFALSPGDFIGKCPGLTAPTRWITLFLMSARPFDAAGRLISVVLVVSLLG